MPETKPNQFRFLRLLAEFTVIFLSVVMAFFFEDFRESRNEKEQYVEALSIFQAELDEVLWTLHFVTDSFKVSNGYLNRGGLYEKVLILNWLDSLMDQKNATMIDFKFMIESKFLDEPTPSAVSISPLVDEIRTKYGEYAHNRIKSRFLPRYKEEMKRINGKSIRLDKYYTELNKIIRRTNPYLDYNEQDSLLFYSNEFVWLYKKIVNLRREEHEYKLWLAQHRLIGVIEAVNDELDRYGVLIPESAKCYKLDFLGRFECWEGRSIESEMDTVKNIYNILTQRINEYKAHLPE